MTKKKTLQHSVFQSAKGFFVPGAGVEPAQG